jgi:hypothetical protein
MCIIIAGLLILWIVYQAWSTIMAREIPIHEWQILLLVLFPKESVHDAAVAEPGRQRPVQRQ